MFTTRCERECYRLIGELQTNSNFPAEFWEPECFSVARQPQDSQIASGERPEKTDPHSFRSLGRLRKSGRSHQCVAVLCTDPQIGFTHCSPTTGRSMCRPLWAQLPTRATANRQHSIAHSTAASPASRSLVPASVPPANSSAEVSAGTVSRSRLA